MPRQNRFQHQPYVAWDQPPIPVRVEAVRQDQVAEIDVGPTLRRLRVQHVLFVHGTFVGDDPFGLAQRLEELTETLPAMLRPVLKVIALEAWGQALRAVNRQFSDKVIGEIGSFRDDYLADFRNLVGDEGPAIERFDWSSGNNHLSRAQAAIDLFNRLTDMPLNPNQDRIVLWGHSHAGNVFALLTNLLANHRDSVKQFFSSAGEAIANKPEWQTARDRLNAAPGPHPLSKCLNIVTCGTPIRYGWDRDGYARLLHICHHRPVKGLADYLAKPALPQLLEEIVQARFGDWVQSLGIAGTDLQPLSDTERTADRALGALLQAGLNQPQVELEKNVLDHLPPMIRDKFNDFAALLGRWRCGSRIATDGDAAWLFDYGAEESALFGHGVYTKRAWLPFHATRVAEWLRKSWES